MLNQIDFLHWMGGETYIHNFGGVKKLDGFSDNKCNVFIGGPPFIPLGWEILSDTVSIEAAHTIDHINDVISNVYEYVLGNKIYENDDVPINTENNANDITEESIFTKLRDNFVFLKAGEKYTASYNLIGFQLVGGDYCFKSYTDSLSGFVYPDDPYWDKNQEKWEYNMTPLPAKVKEYKLFSGMVNTNNVSVRFKKSQKK